MVGLCYLERFGLNKEWTLECNMHVVDYQNIDLTDEEWAYYQELVKQLGADDFRGLFKTDAKGLITTISPTKPVAWLAIFWAQNIMISQHLRENDSRIEALEQKLKGH
jgi:hypothetical protein